MPRKRSVEPSCEEQLKSVEEKLARYRNYIKELEKTRQELLQKKQESDVKALYQYMMENDISVPEVMAVISAKATATKEV